MTRDFALTRKALWHTAVFDLGIALSYILMAPSRTSSTVYDPARAVLSFETFVYPIRAWGALLLLMTVVFILVLSRFLQFQTPALLCLAAFWTFWAVLYLAWIMNGGSLVAFIFCIAFADRHWMMVERATAVIRGV